MEVVMPQLGETVAEGTVAVWHKAEGDSVEAEELLLDVETDKVTMEITAPTAGRLAQILVQAGQTVEVGTLLAVIERAAGVEAESSDSAAATARGAEEAGSSRVGGAGNGAAAGDVPLSPAVRRLCSEHHLDPSEVRGSGRKGRITKKDVLQFLDRDGLNRSSDPDQVAEQPVRPDSADTADSAEGVGRPFNRIRKLTAKHMVRSKATSPHVLQAVEVDFTAVERVRSANKALWKESQGYSLTCLPFIARAVCSALGEFPDLNASVQGDGLVLHQAVNLAIAVDLGREGLVAPVIRRAQELTVAGLARRVQELSGLARAGKLRPDDLAAGTYTLSNSGTFGTLITAPIINQPQVAILSIDGIRKRPVVVEGPEGDGIAIRPVGVLAQSFDHRAVDGAYSARFLHSVRKQLETRDWSAEF